jgi:hypothetical protein
MKINEALEAARNTLIHEYRLDGTTIYIANADGESWILYPSKGGAVLTCVKGAVFEQSRFDVRDPVTLKDFKDPYIRQALALRLVTLFYLSPSMESDKLKAYGNEDLAETRQHLEFAKVRLRDLWND